MCILHSKWVENVHRRCIRCCPPKLSVPIACVDFLPFFTLRDLQNKKSHAACASSCTA